MSRISRHTSQKMYDQFKLFDADGSGKLSHEEFAAVLTRGDSTFDASSAKDLIMQFDKNGDGELDYAEFCDAIVGMEVLARADERKLPEHLRLGLTVDAIQEHLDSLPADAVEKCNAAIPKGEDGTPLYPANDELNGYVNQVMIKQQDPSSSFCERLQRAGKRGVGVATVFISWWLGMTLHILVDALRQYLRQHPELPGDTKFCASPCVELAASALASSDQAAAG